jgi:hypothetical protein
MNTPHATHLYKRHRFPAEIISHCVWLYYRFSLSYRDVEELMAERGVTLSHEAVRYWHTWPRPPGSSSFLILLANPDALKCRLACRLCEGIQALKPPLQKPQLWGGEIGSPTVSRTFFETYSPDITNIVRCSACRLHDGGSTGLRERATTMSLGRHGSARSRAERRDT